MEKVPKTSVEAVRSAIRKILVLKEIDFREDYGSFFILPSTDGSRLNRFAFGNKTNLGVDTLIDPRILGHSGGGFQEDPQRLIIGLDELVGGRWDGTRIHEASHARYSSIRVRFSNAPTEGDALPEKIRKIGAEKVREFLREEIGNARRKGGPEVVELGERLWLLDQGYYSTLSSPFQITIAADRGWIGDAEKYFSLGSYNQFRSNEEIGGAILNIRAILQRGGRDGSALRTGDLSSISMFLKRIELLGSQGAGAFVESFSHVKKSLEAGGIPRVVPIPAGGGKYYKVLRVGHLRNDFDFPMLTHYEKTLLSGLSNGEGAARTAVIAYVERQWKIQEALHLLFERLAKSAAAAEDEASDFALSAELARRFQEEGYAVPEKIKTRLASKGAIERFVKLCRRLSGVKAKIEALTRQDLLSPEAISALEKDFLSP